MKTVHSFLIVRYPIPLCRNSITPIRGKTGYKFAERYRDPLTGKTRRVSVVMEKDTLMNDLRSARWDLYRIKIAQGREILCAIFSPGSYSALRRRF